MPCMKTIIAMREYPVLTTEQEPACVHTRARVASFQSRSHEWSSRALGRLCSAALCFTLAGLPTFARADDDATIGMARERFKEGVQYFDQKQYDKARAAFLQAYALKPHPAVLLNLAQSELRAGHEAAAAKHFAQYLREHQAATDAERQSAEGGLAAAKAKVAEVTVSVDEEGATISADGAAEGTSPLSAPVYLKPGNRTITATKEDREGSVQVTAVAGQSMSANIRLRRVSPSAATPPSAAGKPREETPRDAESEEPEAQDTKAAEQLEYGATSAGREPFFDWVSNSPVAWIGGTVGVLGLGGGVTFWILSRQNYADADSIAAQIRDEAIRMGDVPQGICRMPNSYYKRACDRYTTNSGNGDDFRTAAWVSAGVGALALTGTVVYYLVSTPSESTSSGKKPAPRRATVTPWFGPDGHGVSVVGAF